MLALTDNQLAVVMTAAGGLPVEKRGLFLERVAGRLRLLDRFTDSDLDDAVRTALAGTGISRLVAPAAISGGGVGPLTGGGFSAFYG